MQLKKEKKYLSLLLLWFNTLTSSAIWKAEMLVHVTLYSPSGVNKLCSVQYKSLWRACNPCDSTALPCWEGNKRADGQETWVSLRVGSDSILLVSGQWSVLGTSYLRVQKARRYEKLLSLFFFPTCKVYDSDHTTPHLLLLSGEEVTSVLPSERAEKPISLMHRLQGKKILTNTLFITNCSFGLPPYPWWLPGNQVSL